MKTVCIYHSIDLDGWMSAAIVKHFYNQDLYSDGKLVNTIDFIGYNYGDPTPDLSKYNKIIMCDISFLNDVMLSIHESKRLEDFVYIDHHDSAIKAMYDYCSKAGYTVPAGLRDTNYAACELTWKYFFPNETMPEIVRLLGRYDCFGSRGTDEKIKVLEFQYGARSVISNYEKAYRELCDNIYCENTELAIWNKGKAIYSYLCTDAKQIYKTGFDITFSRITDLDIITHYKFICINKERFNPINFGIDYHKPIEEVYWCIERKDKYGLLCNDLTIDETSNSPKVLKFKTKEEAEKELNSISSTIVPFSELFYIAEHMWISPGYDGVACFHYANGMWNFSLYNDNGEVDCSVIAKQFGGGGHKGAAGFRIKDINKIIK